VLADDGKVYDTDRVMSLRSYLTQLQRATADGVPINGYFQWSTMDNFEWTEGLLATGSCRWSSRRKSTRSS
jgi:beta-glucosidase